MEGSKERGESKSRPNTLTWIKGYNRVQFRTGYSTDKTMYPKLILLLIQLICSGFLRAESTRNWPLAQEPAKYLFVPQNHRMQDEIVPPDKNPYILYYPPVMTGDYLQTKQNYGYVPRVLTHELPPLKKFKSSHNNPPHMTLTSGHVSRYMEPPDVDATSTYEKYHNHPMSEDSEREVNFLPYNHKPDVKFKKKPVRMHNDRPMYIRDHAPLRPFESESEKASESKHDSKKKSKKEPSLELSPDGDRVEFQIQGHEGPKTYIFGFDTGDGKGRQFRLEERLRDGTVKGHYGYYDARGKLRTIRYLARPMEGYQEKHHESSNASSEEE